MKLLKALHLKPTEWICIGFLFLASLCIFISPHPEAWKAVRWEVFPKTDLFALTVCILILKTKDSNHLKTGALLFCTLLSYLFFSHEDSILPQSVFRFFSSIPFFTYLRWFLFLPLLSFFKHNFRLLLSEIRIFLPLLVMVCLYPLIPVLIAAFERADQDTLLKNLDIWFFYPFLKGQNPILFFEKFIHPVLSEWFAFCYSIYGFLFLVVFALLSLQKERKGLNELIFNTTLALAIGFLGYALMPAIGPLYIEKFDQSLQIYYLADIKKTLMDQTRIDRDCFPSLHTVISLILLHASYQRMRIFFWILFPILISIPAACIYLRYHYVSDVLAGLVLFLFIIIIQINRVGGGSK